jgi:hypothetical protein
MYRALAIVLVAYAICYPRIDTQASVNTVFLGDRSTRAERMLADFSLWLSLPLQRVADALHNARRNRG